MYICIWHLQTDTETERIISYMYQYNIILITIHLVGLAIVKVRHSPPDRTLHCEWSSHP